MSTDFSNAPIARERSGDQADEHSGERPDPNCFERGQFDNESSATLVFDAL